MRRLTASWGLISALLCGPLFAQALDCAPPGDDPDRESPDPATEMVCEQQPRQGLWLSWDAAEVKVCLPAASKPKLVKAVNDAACRCTADDPSVPVFGDLTFMRAGGQTTRLDPGFTHRLATAYMTQNPEEAERYLAPDLTGARPDRKAFAHVTLAQIAMRANSTRASALLADADRAARAAGLSLADINYLKAVAATDAGDIAAARDLVDDALAVEPAFFNARFLRLVIALREWARGGKRDCAIGLESVFDNLSALLALSPCPVHATYVDSNIVALRFIETDAAPVALVRLALALVAQAPHARVELEAQIIAGLEKDQMPAQCTAIVTRELAALKARYPLAAE